jgi:hypothetical protein
MLAKNYCLYNYEGGSEILPSGFFDLYRLMNKGYSVKEIASTLKTSISDVYYQFNCLYTLLSFNIDDCIHRERIKSLNAGFALLEELRLKNYFMPKLDSLEIGKRVVEFDSRARPCKYRDLIKIRVKFAIQGFSDSGIAEIFGVRDYSIKQSLSLLQLLIMRSEAYHALSSAREVLNLKYSYEAIYWAFVINSYLYGAFDSEYDKVYNAHFKSIDCEISI